MEKIDGYWVDENGNRWNDCSKERAKELSSGMIDCYNCYNCQYCDNCYYCDNCCNCDNCYYCDNCCICDNCCNCWDCQGCQDCRDCQKYTDNPMLYRTAEIGSRNGQTTFFYGETKNGMSLQIVCGCFRGNLEEFEKKVLETHKTNELYRNQYLREIQKVKVLFELEERGAAYENMEIK